jgi:hypothetical protein
MINPNKKLRRKRLSLEKAMRICSREVPSGTKQFYAKYGKKEKPQVRPESDSKNR